jgi:hypothetical protein
MSDHCSRWRIIQANTAISDLGCKRLGRHQGKHARDTWLGPRAWPQRETHPTTNSAFPHGALVLCLRGITRVKTCEKIFQASGRMTCNPVGKVQTPQG